MTLPSVQNDAAAAVSRFASVLERMEVRKQLDGLCAEWWGRHAQQVRLQALKCHVRHRCTFEVALQTEIGWRSVIAKVYVTDRSDLFRSMDAVSRAGFGADAEFSIPRPLAYVPSSRVLLEEKVPGPSAKEIFLSGNPREHAEAAERSGRWLARFHAAAPQIGAARERSDQWARYRRWMDQIRAFGEPALIAKADQLFRKLEAALPTPDTMALRAGHGSYIPEHVMLSDRRTAVIDLDECDVADPGRDLAWFVVSLQRMALRQLGSLQALDRIAEHFLQSYLSASRGDGVAHLPVFRALECLNRARHDLIKQLTPAPERAHTMLDEGLRHL